MDNKSNYDVAFDKVLELEGGYQLTDHANDKGGQTYAGISRRYNPSWEGWALIDAGERKGDTLEGSVKRYYREHYWKKIGGEGYAARDVAVDMMTSAVHNGVRKATKMAQYVAKVPMDGIMGPRTMAAINQMDMEKFVAMFKLTQIFRYAEIVRDDPTQRRYFLGWIMRLFR